MTGIVHILKKKKKAVICIYLDGSPQTAMHSGAGEGGRMIKPQSNEEVQSSLLPLLCFSNIIFKICEVRNCTVLVDGE